MDTILLSSKPIEISEYKTYKEATFLISVLDEWDLNGRMITKEAGEKYHKTIIGFPIVAKLIRDREGNPVDFRGHEMKIIQNEDGSVDYVFDTQAIGAVLDSWIEQREVDGYKGNKDCIMIKCKLWTERFPEYFEVLDKLWAENNVKTSWELTVEKCKNTLRGKIIEAFSFLGNTLLGSDIEGAVPGAGAYEYAELNSNDNLSNDLVLASALSNDCKQISDINIEQKEETNLKKPTQEVAKEEVIETSTETSEGNVEETTPAANEVSEDENSECKDKKEKSETADDDKEEENDDSDKKDDKEVSELTEYDLRSKINEEVRKVVKWGWVCYMFPADSYVLVKDDNATSELEYLKFTYTVSDDVVTLGEPETVKLVVSVAEINTKIAEKDDAIVSANAEIQTLKAEIETLATYKERCEKEDAEKAENEIAEKQNSLRQYALDSKQITKAELETEEFMTIISELDGVKLKSIISDRCVASLTKKNSKVETSEVEVSEKPKANIDTVEDVTDYRSAIKSFLGK
jgi:hypothetical protein